MKKYNIYGIGAALVDTEVEVSDEFSGQCSIDKGVMTLVDEARQAELIGSLSAEIVPCFVSAVDLSVTRSLPPAAWALKRFLVARWLMMRMASFTLMT